MNLSGPFIPVKDCPEMPLLETERLWLRGMGPEVWKHIFMHCTDAELMAFLGLETQDELSVERRKFLDGLGGWNRSFMNFQLILKSEHQVIGGCGFHTWMLLHRRAELGYALKHDRHKGQGYMSEALPPIIAYGFGVMRLHRIEALIGPNNIASQRLVQKMGFKQEGYLREHYCKDGRMEDSLVFSLLRREFGEG